LAKQRRRDEREERVEGAMVETVIKIFRCSTVVKGGRRFSFSALVVVGDGAGRVGLGYGKAKEVPLSVEKGTKEAHRNAFDVKLKGTTIPHQVVGRYKATSVLLKPARPGTGLIAGSAVRAVLEAAGVKDMLTKVYGAGNTRNIAKATLAGLQSLKTRQEMEELRGVKIG